MKKKRIYIQRSLFDNDELIAVTENKPLQYDQYIKGAVDMLCRIMTAEERSNLLHGRENVIHLPRKYMEAFCKEALRDRNFLFNYISGHRVSYNVERDECGRVRAVSAKIQTK